MYQYTLGYSLYVSNLIYEKYFSISVILRILNTTLITIQNTLRQR